MRTSEDQAGNEDDRTPGELSAARETLAGLNRHMTSCLSAREKRIAWTRAYWDGKPRTMLNERLERIEIEKHYALFTLETAPIRAERECLLDALAQVEMANPPTLPPVF